MHDFDFSSLFGSAAGGGAVVILARAYLQRAFSELDGLVKAMQSVQKELALIALKLEKIEKVDETLRDHDRKLTTLEAWSKSRSCNNVDRMCN